MNCPSTIESGRMQLLDFAIGRLDRATKQVVGAHVRECPACAKEVASQRALWGVLDEWDAEPISFGFDRILYARIEEINKRSLRSQVADFFSELLARPAMPLAALTLLILAALLIRTPNEKTPPSVIQPISAPVAGSTTFSPGEMEQLNRTIEDLQLLHQLDEVEDEAKSASGAM